MPRPSTDASDREKMPVSISLLDSNQFDDSEFDSIVNMLTEGTGYMEQRLRPIYKRNRQVRLFFAQQTKSARWVGFFKSALQPDQPIVHAKNRIASFVCFVGAGDRTFVITGGLGKFLVQDYIDQNFGMDILVRLIKKDAPNVRSLQDRGVAGTVLGERRFFRGRQRLADEDQFGKIYKEINAVLNNHTLLKQLGFAESEVKQKKAGCWARSSFLLGKSIGFDKMLNITERLSEIRDKKPNFSLNHVIHIRNRGEKNKLLIEALFAQLKDVLYSDCSKDRIPDFDFCHWDFENYLTASSYCVDIDGEDDMNSDEPIELKDLISHFKAKKRWTIDSLEEFDHGVLQRKLFSFDDGGTEQTSGTILDHFHGEVAYQGRKYFFLDRQWYQIEEDFVKGLNVQCQAVIDQYLDEKLLTLPCDAKKAESLFTDKYFGYAGCIVLDTITEEHIELCDLLIYPDGEIYLIHIKRGFNNSMRELSAQVSLAARRLAQDTLSNYEFISSIEDHARSLHSSPNLRLQKIAKQSFPTGGLAKLFKETKLNKIVFCLAFADFSDQARHIKTDLHLFESNMAKHSLLQLSHEVRKHGFEFKIIQLPKP